MDNKKEWKMADERPSKGKGLGNRRRPKRDIRGLSTSVTLCLTFLAAILMTATAFAQDVSTSFEFDDTSGQFTLGEPPNTVSFTGGEAKTVGITALYHSGLRSWMIDAGNTGAIAFNTPAAEVGLFFRDQNSSSVLLVFGTGGEMLTTLNGTASGWTQVDLNAGELGDSIGSIRLQNNGDSGYAVIDDFSFTASVADGGNCEIGGSEAGAVVSDTIDTAECNVMTLLLSQQPSVPANGRLYVALEVPTVPELAGFTFFRPSEDQVPLPNGGLVRLAKAEAGFLPDAGEFAFFEGMLGGGDLSFDVGTEGLQEQTVIFETLSLPNGMEFNESNLESIQRVEVSFQ